MSTNFFQRARSLDPGSTFKSPQAPRQFTFDLSAIRQAREDLQNITSDEHDVSENLSPGIATLRAHSLPPSSNVSLPHTSGRHSVDQRQKRVYRHSTTSGIAKRRRSGRVTSPPSCKSTFQQTQNRDSARMPPPPRPSPLSGVQQAQAPHRELPQSSAPEDVTPVQDMQAQLLQLLDEDPEEARKICCDNSIWSSEIEEICISLGIEGEAAMRLSIDIFFFWRERAYREGLPREPTQKTPPAGSEPGRE
jgi:hypothetical protein